jgi:hypothetical protein
MNLPRRAPRSDFGEIAAQGAPANVVTDTLIAQVFGLRCRVVADPVTASPLVVPIEPSSPWSRCRAERADRCR